MTDRTARIVRVLTFLAFGLVILFVLIRFFADDPGSRLTAAEVRSGELDIPQALAVGPDETVVVRGFLFFDEERGLRLCTFREKGNPPECQEPYFDLIGIDRSSFNFDKSARVEELDDLRLYWIEETVAVSGTVNGRELTVQDVLQ